MDIYKRIEIEMINIILGLLLSLGIGIVIGMIIAFDINDEQSDIKLTEADYRQEYLQELKKYSCFRPIKWTYYSIF